MPIRISTRLDDMDLDVIHDFLSRSYWSPGVPREVVEKAMHYSRCDGAFDGDQQIGFARMITDRATFAYLADVFVLSEYRGQGVSRQLMDNIASDPELQGLRRIMLATRDAHGLYRKYGFEALDDPSIFMQRWNPSVYEK